MNKQYLLSIVISYSHDVMYKKFKLITNKHKANREFNKLLTNQLSELCDLYKIEETEDVFKFEEIATDNRHTVEVESSFFGFISGDGEYELEIELEEMEAI